ncbi:hypothetical protein BTS2_2139 [Bacillus sp. TS-2]|nr:hypothetical protein BTS2_2139 [Bacillus sp. TS-2]
MTGRKQVESILNKAENSMKYAEMALANARRVQPIYKDDLQKAQEALMEVSDELIGIKKAASKQQQYQLLRTEQQMRQLQNRFILRRYPLND